MSEVKMSDLYSDFARKFAEIGHRDGYREGYREAFVDGLKEVLRMALANAPRPALPSAVRDGEARKDELRQADVTAAREEGRMSGHLAGWQSGIEQGAANARRDMLLRQLGLRFGELPHWVRGRLQGASGVHAERWADRVLTAATLDEVFAD